MYLIQRNKLKTFTNDADRDDPLTFDGAFMLDYMGSAQFEDGSVSKSLHQILGELDQYSWERVIVHTNDGDEAFVHLLCREQDKWTLADRLATLAVNPYDRVKENTYLDKNIVQEDPGYCTVDLWWCLDEETPAMFTLSEDVKKLLDPVLANTKAKIER